MAIINGRRIQVPPEGITGQNLRAFPNSDKWGKLLLDEASSLVEEIS